MRYLILFTLIVIISSLNAQTIDSVAIKQVDSLILVSRDLTAKKDFDQALAVNAAAEKIALEKIGPESAAYGSCSFNRGRVNYFKGDKPEAEKWYLKAKVIREKTLGREHPDYANTLNNLAIIYKDMGNYEQAETYYLQSKEIREKTLGREHPDYASSLYNLANLYLDLGNYEKAEAYYLESKEIREKILGREHLGYAQSLNNLASLYKNLGNYEKAEAYYLESKEIWEKTLGREHPYYALSLNNLSSLYETQSRCTESPPLLAEALTLSRTRIAGSISFLSERELAKYAATKQGSSKINAYLLNRPVEQADMLPELSYDQSLFTKGFLMQAAARLQQLTSSSPQATAINNDLKGYHRRIAQQLSLPIAQRKGVEELKEKANVLEKELSRTVAGYSEAMKQVKWQDVQLHLKQTDAAIEFISFKNDFPKTTDSFMYAALILKSGDKQPQFIPLFEEKSLDSLLNTKSDRKSDYANSLYTLADRGAIAIEAPKKSLYDLIWKPLEKELTGIKTVYYAPSGLLHRINLDAIPISDTETLADMYQLVAVNSTRQLVIPDQVKVVNNEAVLYGGILYEQDSILEVKEALFATRTRGSLTFSSVDSTLRGGTWNYLAGTEREVNAIEKIMQTSGVQTNLKKGYAATEESFKNIGVDNNPSPRILHIATHGYFFNDPDRANSAKSGVTHDSAASKGTAKAAPSNSKASILDTDPVFKISDHPMLRSGLIMSGGNVAWQGKQTLEGREDGVLTAYEISQMNLSNTELVVLSACETGLGDIQGNEGVYGLQRAFKIAGAKYLIMSLWQVPDKQTSLLMTTFYKKWLEEKLNIPNAFHAAQKELRDNGLDPYNWAGFVLVE
ncbi:MAG: tetratricopeptide repeat protein [Saprospiraceae bacterium]